MKEQRSRWAWSNNITRCPGEFESVGDRMPVWESACRWGLVALSDPRLSNPAKMRKKCCYGRRRTWDQYSSLSPSSTHLSHTWNITLLRIKCERYIFIKKCVHSFIEGRILSVPHIFVFYYTTPELTLNLTIEVLLQLICKLSTNFLFFFF